MGIRDRLLLAGTILCVVATTVWSAPSVTIPGNRGAASEAMAGNGSGGRTGMQIEVPANHGYRRSVVSGLIRARPHTATAMYSCLMVLSLWRALWLV